MPHDKDFEAVRVSVHGHEVVTYGFGSGSETLFCLNGGPLNLPPTLGHVAGLLQTLCCSDRAMLA